MFADLLHLNSDFIVTQKQINDATVRHFERINSFLRFSPVEKHVLLFLEINSDMSLSLPRSPFSMSLNGIDDRVPNWVWAGVQTYPGAKEMIYLPEKYISNTLILSWVYLHEVRHVLTRLVKFDFTNLEILYEEIRKQLPFGIDERQLSSVEEFDAEIFAMTNFKNIFGEEVLQKFINTGADDEQTVRYFDCLVAREKMFGTQLPKGI